MAVQTIQTKTLSMCYLRFGNPEGQPFVILPGVAVRSVMLSEDAIRAQYGALAETYDLYVLDRRTDMPELYPVMAMAEDTCQALDALHLQGAVVYGVSQGGMIALAMAVQRPDLVGKLVLCSTAAHTTPALLHIMQEWDSLAAVETVPALMRSFAENVYTPAYCEMYRDAFQAFGSTVTAEDLHRFRIMLRGLAGFDVRERLQQIQCPVLVMAGAQDKLFGTEAAQTIAASTQAALAVFPDGAHGVYDEDPDVLGRIIAFLG